MGLFGMFTRTITNRAADVGDNLRNGAVFLGNHVAGGFGGGGAYASLRASVQGFYAREMIDSKISKRSLKSMRRASRHLSKFDEKHLSKTFERYADDPVKLQVKVTKIVVRYTSDLTIFVTEYTGFLQAVNDELVERARMISANDQFAVTLFNDFTRVARETNTYVPQVQIEQTRQRIASLAKVEGQTTAKDTAELKKEESGVKIKLGLGYRILGVGWIVHKAKKATRKYNSVTLLDMNRNIIDLDRQVAEAKLQPTWLPGFNRHLDAMKRADKFLAEIAHDARVTLAVAEKDATIVVRSMEVFISIFKNTVGVQLIIKDYESMKEIHSKVYASIRNDLKDMAQLNVDLQRLKEAMERNLGYLRTASADVLFKLKQRADAFESAHR
jgi:hypothetical protein